MSGDAVSTDHPGSDELGELIEVLRESRSLGFLGPGDVEGHLDHARPFVDFVDTSGARVLDLGSGGGVPGLIVAVLRRDLSVTLLDAGARRILFLEQAVGRLGLDVGVEHGRAEDLARRPDLRGAFDVVTARSFGAPPVTAECAVGFLKVGGRVLVSEPPDPPMGRWPSEACARLGLAPVGLESRGGATVQVLELRTACPEEYPRANGVPARRPLW